MATWKIPDNLLEENGGYIRKVENDDGTITYINLNAKADGVGSYTGAGMPDMSRNKERAGKKVEEKGFELTYDEDGYCVSARNLDWVVPKDPETEGGYFKSAKK